MSDPCQNGCNGCDECTDYDDEDGEILHQRAMTHNVKVRDAAPLYGAASLSTDGLCSSAPRKGGE